MTNEKILEEIYWGAYELGVLDELRKLVEENGKQNSRMGLVERVELAASKIEVLKQKLYLTN
jgi:hypothetical protein